MGELVLVALVSMVVGSWLGKRYASRTEVVTPPIAMHSAPIPRRTGQKRKPKVQDDQKAAAVEREEILTPDAG